MVNENSLLKPVSKGPSGEVAADKSEELNALLCKDEKASMR